MQAAEPFRRGYIQQVLTSGSMIAGYRIERVLGEGQMGTVFLARSPDLPRYESLKVLNKELSDDADFQARFLREANVVAQLTHPNIVTVYRRGRDDGLLWIAMEYVPGTDADTALQNGQMTPARAVHVIEEIAKALDFAHQRHVVHRDVKPANFLLSGDSSHDERVLLGDFGVARYKGQNETSLAGSVFATVAYAAPEVLAGRPSDGRADLYSLGCSLFRLLTGRTPYPGGPAAAVIEAHLRQPPPRVTDLVPGLPPAIDDVIATAMAKDPADRYQTGRELAEAAARALGVKAHSQAPISVSPRESPRPMIEIAAQTSALRRKPLVLGLGAAAIILIGVLIGALVLSRGPSGGGSDASRDTPAEPLVEPGALPRLLLSEAKITSILGTPMRLGASTNQPIDYSRKIVSTECAAAYGPIAQSTYAGSGYTALEANVFTAANPDPKRGTSSVQQAVVAYPSADAAESARDRQVDQWRQCAKRSAIRQVDPSDPSAEVKFADVVVTDDDVALLAQAVGPSGVACDRGLGVKNNVVIDSIVCQADSATQQVLDLVRDITAEVA
ncbi:MAG: sensor domain-containing protein [Mycobacterium sp.]|nr:sensor domain-containing protein [Mycobacterium sp.]